MSQYREVSCVGDDVERLQGDEGRWEMKKEGARAEKSFHEPKHHHTNSQPRTRSLKPSQLI